MKFFVLIILIVILLFTTTNSKKFEIEKNLLKKEEPNFVCAGCILAFSAIIQHVDRDRDSIIKAMKELCGVLPPVFELTCKFVINNLANNIIDRILGKKKFNI
jgi:hypothetical protein